MEVICQLNTCYFDLTQMLYQTMMIFNQKTIILRLQLMWVKIYRKKCFYKLASEIFQEADRTILNADIVEYEALMKNFRNPT